MMILYTPLANEDIFPADQGFGNRQVVSYNGKSMYCEKKTDGTYEILQLLSTDPQDFLNQQFSPGTIISKDNNH